MEKAVEHKGNVVKEQSAGHSNDRRHGAATVRRLMYRNLDVSRKKSRSRRENAATVNPCVWDRQRCLPCPPPGVNGLSPFRRKRTCRMMMAERFAPRSASQCIRLNRRAFAEGLTGNISTPVRSTTTKIYLAEQKILARSEAWLWPVVRCVNSMLSLKSSRRFAVIHYAERVLSKLADGTSSSHACGRTWIAPCSVFASIDPRTRIAQT